MKITLQQKVLAIVMVVAMLFSQMAIMSSAISENIESVTAVAQKSLIENIDGYLKSDYNDETGEYDPEYFYYDFWDTKPIFTVTYKDGRVFIGDKYDIQGVTGYGIDYYSDQSYYNQWGVGKHNFTVEFLGVEGVCEVKIIETPVENIIVDDIKIIEGTYGDWYHKYNEETDIYEKYFKYFLYPELTVVLKDGTKLKSEYGSVEYNGKFYPLYICDNQYDSHWRVGTHTVDASFLGKECTINVEILESPIESAVLTPLRDFIEDIDDLDDIDLIDYSAVITYKNGTTETVKLNEFLQKNNAHIWYETESSKSSVGTHTINYEFMGISVDAEVNVVENPYNAITISGENELNITFHKKDGTTVTAKATGFSSKWRSELEVEGILETDKGNFYINVVFSSDGHNYDKYNNVVVHLGNLKSNILTNNNFFKAHELSTHAVNAVLLRSSYSSSFKGYDSNNSEYNVDDVIALSVYMSNYLYKDLFIELKEEVVKELVFETFGITDIDITKSTFYNAGNKVIFIQLLPGYGDGPPPDLYVVKDVKFLNNQWVFTRTVNHYSGKTEKMVVVFNEDFTIDKISLNPSVTEELNGWVEEGGKWAYYENGVKVIDKWVKDSKGWCYLDLDGYMATSKWVKDSKGWCYVGTNGYCVTNCWKKDS